jgi:hypothetical protein
VGFQQGAVGGLSIKFGGVRPFLVNRAGDMTSQRVVSAPRISILMVRRLGERIDRGVSWVILGWQRWRLVLESLPGEPI